MLTEILDCIGRDFVGKSSFSVMFKAEYANRIADMLCFQHQTFVFTFNQVHTWIEKKISGLFLLFA